MRILLIYPGHLFSTFDVARGYDLALQQNDGVVLGAFAYHGALTFYQDAIKTYREKHPDKEMPDGACITMASERVAVQAVEFKPDIALVVSGMVFGRHGYELLMAMDIPIAFILTESPYLDEPQAQMMRATDACVAFTNDKWSVDRLTDETGVRTVYLPHSYLPGTHRPMETNGVHQTDVFFHGALWPERLKMFEGLENLPYNVRIGGVNLDSMYEEKINSIIDNSTLPLWYSGTKIALNHHRTCIGSGDDVTYIDPASAYSVGPRAFEIAACGGFQLCDDARPELTDIFGDSVATYHGRDELRDKIDYFMQHPAERRDMAMESRRRVEGCTFAARATNILVPTLREAI